MPLWRNCFSRPDMWWAGLSGGEFAPQNLLSSLFIIGDLSAQQGWFIFGDMLFARSFEQSDMANFSLASTKSHLQSRAFFLDNPLLLCKAFVERTLEGKRESLCERIFFLCHVHMHISLSQTVSPGSYPGHFNCILINWWSWGLS